MCRRRSARPSRCRTVHHLSTATALFAERGSDSNRMMTRISLGQISQGPQGTNPSRARRRNQGECGNCRFVWPLSWNGKSDVEAPPVSLGVVDVRAIATGALPDPLGWLGRGFGHNSVATCNWITSFPPCPYLFPKTVEEREAVRGGECYPKGLVSQDTWIWPVQRRKRFSAGLARHFAAGS